MAVCRCILSKQDIVMRKVVTLRVLECQLDMVQLSVGGDIHRQARPGKVAGIVEADVMFNDRGFRPSASSRWWR